MEFGWVMGGGLNWFVGPKLLLCDGLGWVSRLVAWGEEIGPTNNSVRNVSPKNRQALYALLEVKLPHHRPLAYVSVTCRLFSSDTFTLCNAS